MSVMATSRTHIRRISAEVFADRVWPRWSTYVDAAEDRASELAPIVTRQFVWHMGEVMGLAGETNALWHPFENWLCPPLSPNRVHTGDVYKLEGTLWIVLTPPCDLANDGKVSDVSPVAISTILPTGTTKSES